MCCGALLHTGGIFFTAWFSYILYSAEPIPGRLNLDVDVQMLMVRSTAFFLSHTGLFLRRNFGEVSCVVICGFGLKKGLHFDATRASLMHWKWNMFAVGFRSCETKFPSLKTFHFGDFEAG